MRLREDETGFVAVTWGDRDLGGPRSAPEALERLDSTEEFWRELAARRQIPRPPVADPPAALGAGPQGPHLRADRGDRRRADDLAAGDPGRRTQLGLPLHLDPRRDLHPLGPAHPRLRRGGDAPSCASSSGSAARIPKLQIMYGIGGEKHLTESTLDHLDGYGGAKPVRIGNGAFDQNQHDVWGALLDSIYLHEKALRGSGTQADREIIRSQVEAAIEAWQIPDQGIWESRGEPKHYVSSKLMIWVAVDRGARLAESVGLDEIAGEWRRQADEFKQELLEKGCRDGVFRQHYETDALDASTLLIPLVRFLPPDDERVVKTVEAIADAADRTRPRPPLPGRRDRRRPLRGRGNLPDLLLLAGLGALGDRRERPRPRPLRTAAGVRRLARPLRRGARPGQRPPPRQLPAGLHPPGADQRRLPRDRRRAAQRRRHHRGLHRDGRRPRAGLRRRRRGPQTKRLIQPLYCCAAWRPPPFRRRT